MFSTNYWLNSFMFLIIMFYHKFLHFISTQVNDIALITLDSPVEDIKPIPLPRIGSTLRYFNLILVLRYQTDRKTHSFLWWKRSLTALYLRTSFFLPTILILHILFYFTTILERNKDTYNGSMVGTIV